MLGASSTNFGNGKGVLRNMDSATNICIDTINLPQVTNGQEFVSYLKNFEMDMTRKAYR